ncbi:MAG: calcium-binding protein [Hyphomonadaceae bacterium]|nr:calcium-binding protein [Hyphomonadaceae bacterium]
MAVFPSSSADLEVFRVTDTTRTIDGGSGSDILDAGDLQLRWQSLWNTPESSGATFQAIDPITGRSWSLDVRNIEAVVGSPHSDKICANAQMTSLLGEGGDDVLVAAMDSPLPTFMRGGEGADSIAGGEVFDDINGNQGDDTLNGFEDGDWVAGGQGDDFLFGDSGRDVVYGNLGDDTCEGGADGDIVRGGQGNDSVVGGGGDDWLAGDRGSDTIAGGAGADVFNSFAGAGLDLITDFNGAEGDRVALWVGASFSVRQLGLDTIVDLGGGDLVVLVGQQLSSFNEGWIVTN